jgi:hypothetical protein
MIWQDMVFLVGSLTSVMFLYPTLRDKASQVPRATSLPSMLIGAAYSFTFFTLDMTFSAVGALAACTMWSLIAAFRGPDSESYLEETPFPATDEWRPLLAGQYHRLLGDTRRSPTESQDDLDGTSRSD